MKRTALLGISLLFAMGGAAAAEAPAAPPGLARTLILCMDGVGYDLVAEMYARGELRNFLPPAPLITAFPSDTSPSLAEILTPRGAPPARGYEDYYFDPTENRLRGGVFHRLTRKQFIGHTYREVFHYHPDPLRMTLEYGLPVLGPWLNGAITLGRLKAEFHRSAEPVFLAYFDSSDLAAHVSGRWLVREQMRHLDRWVGDLRARSNPPVDVIVFSDHGNDFRKMRKAPLEKALKRAGFRPGMKLKDARSVIFPHYGLISSAVLYTAPGAEAALAESLRDAEGVDFCVYRQDGSLVVVGPRGTVRIERRLSPAGLRFRYRAESGDPLELNGIAAELARAGRADPEGFIVQDDWLHATAGHLYPDPLRRLWASFHGLVEQPASVIVSLEDGYYTGSPVLDVFAALQATHGNLRRGQSRGVVLSTQAGLFQPDRGPFTGENLLRRIALAQKPEPGAEVCSGCSPEEEDLCGN